MKTRSTEQLDKALVTEGESSAVAAASTFVNPSFETGESFVKIPRPKNLPDFQGQAFHIDPDQRTEDVSQWLRVLNRQLSIDIPLGCPPAQAEAYKCKHAICCLKGGAEEWWGSLETTQEELVAECQVSWATLVNTLEARFLPVNLEGKTRDFLKEYGHQFKLQKSVEDYYVYVYVYVYVYISANQLLIEDGMCNYKPPLKHRHQT